MFPSGTYWKKPNHENNLHFPNPGLNFLPQQTPAHGGAFFDILIHAIQKTPKNFIPQPTGGQMIKLKTLAAPTFLAQ